MAFVIILVLSKGVRNLIRNARTSWRNLHPKEKKAQTWIWTHHKSACQEHSVCNIRLQLSRQAKIKERGRAEDTVEEKIMSSPLLAAAELPWRPGVWEAATPLVGSMSHFSPTHALICSGSSGSLVSGLLFLHPHRHTQTWSGTQSHPSFSIFPLIQVRPGQLSLSRRLQPVSMSPLFYFFSWLRVMQTDGSSIMTTNHFCIFKKKAHFSFPQIAEQKFSKWSTYCVIFQRGFK